MCTVQGATSTTTDADDQTPPPPMRYIHPPDASMVAPAR